MKIDINSITYHLADNREAKVIGIRTTSDQVEIPSAVDYKGIQYKVTSIGQSAFRHCSCITSIAIPDTVTRIGYWAFAHCEKLREIVIEHNFKSIGDVFDGAGRTGGKNYGRPLCENEREKRNKPIIQSIRLFLEALQHLPNRKPHNYDYLLGQTIRQYEPAEDHQHVSIRAWNYWQEQAAENEDIRQFEYDWTYALKAYPSKRKKFNLDFIQEHTTPVAEIKKELQAIESIDDKSIMDVLEKMHISRILIEGENDHIKINSKRELDFEVIAHHPKCYGGAGIEFQCSAETIGYEAFKGCNNLQSITIGTKTLSSQAIAKLKEGKRISVD